jgi:A/G-specific adenine glycosylase
LLWPNSAMTILMTKTAPFSPAIAPALLRWYDANKRDLPWRMNHDPYRVWLSEIMLQQTTVAAVQPYFQHFMQKWPKLADFARAPIEEVLTAWAGLGYYARARNLHKCAQTLMREHHGQFPQSEAALLSLPGIGPYTAAAIAAIAFDQPANVVDGNVERVMARLHAVKTPLPAAKAELKRLAAAHVPSQRAGDYAQALMDLGATICTPKTAKCAECPLQKACMAYAQRNAAAPETYPLKSPKAERPIKPLHAYVLYNNKGQILLLERPHVGLLGGMLDVPCHGEGLGRFRPDEIQDLAPAWHKIKARPEHVFTHFKMVATVYVGHSHARTAPMGGKWADLASDGDFKAYAVPTAMKKILLAAMRHTSNEQKTV